MPSRPNVTLRSTWIGAPNAGRRRSKTRRCTCGVPPAIVNQATATASPDRRDDRAVHGTAVDLPVVGVHGRRRGPSAVGEPRDRDVADVGVALVAIRDDDAVSRPRGRRLAALAHLRIDDDLCARRTVRDRRRAHRHAVPRDWPALAAAALAAVEPDRARARCRALRRTTRTRTRRRRCRGAAFAARSTSCRRPSTCAAGCRTAFPTRAAASAPPWCPWT